MLYPVAQVRSLQPRLFQAGFLGWDMGHRHFAPLQRSRRQGSLSSDPLRGKDRLEFDGNHRHKFFHQAPSGLVR